MLEQNDLFIGTGEAPESQVAPSTPAEAPVRSTLSAQNLNKRYKKRTVVHDVSFDVGSGEVVGLLGPNGAGKTTTFYMIVGLVAADGGEVFLDEEKLTHFPIHRQTFQIHQSDSRYRDLLALCIRPAASHPICTSYSRPVSFHHSMHTHKARRTPGHSRCPTPLQNQNRQAPIDLGQNCKRKRKAKR